MEGVGAVPSLWPSVGSPTAPVRRMFACERTALRPSSASAVGEAVWAPTDLLRFRNGRSGQAPPRGPRALHFYEPARAPRCARALAPYLAVVFLPPNLPLNSTVFSTSLGCGYGSGTWAVFPRSRWNAQDVLYAAPILTVNMSIWDLHLCCHDAFRSAPLALKEDLRSCRRS
jgi:hypothetical protein